MAVHPGEERTSEGRIVIEPGLEMDEVAERFIQALRDLGATVVIASDNEPYEFT